MSRFLASPVPVNPTPLDEVAAVLASIPYFPPRRREVDTAYTLPTAVAEVTAWLHGSLSAREATADHRSLVADVSDALIPRGRRVSTRTTAGDALLRELQQLTPKKGHARDPGPALAALEGLTCALAEPETAVAAFDDLVEAVEDAGTPRRIVEGRLAVLTCALDLAGRPVAQICHRLSDIAQDQQYEIDLTLHDLDGTEIRRPDQLDAEAGLAAENLLDLSRRYLRHPPLPAHHVVWLAYQHAPVTSTGGQQVGPVEFFDGPALLAALNDAEATTTPLPGELARLSEEPGPRPDELWPRFGEVRVWAAARVDLGVGNLSDPVKVAKNQAEAIVQLAGFNRGGSTWQLLEGHIHFRDGRRGSFEGFHPAWPGDELRAQTDTTAEEFHGLADNIGLHLPITDVSLERLIAYLSDLNASLTSSEPDLILGDIRAIEFVARQCSSPDWLHLMIGTTSTSHAWNRATQEIYFAVTQARLEHTLILRGGSETDLIEESSGDLPTDAAYDLIPQFLERGPTYHWAMRRLREIAQHTASPESVKAWIDELKVDYKRRLRRAERLRNALTHGDAATHEVAATIRILISVKARNVIRLALESVLEGKPISDSLGGWRQEFRAWERAIATAQTARDALFADHKSAEAV